MTIQYRKYFIAIISVKTCLLLMLILGYKYIHNKLEPYEIHESKYSHILLKNKKSLPLKFSGTNVSLDNYFIYTNGCVISRREAFDPEAKRYYSKPNYIWTCRGNVPLTTQNGTMLYLDNRTISYCQYENIYRKPNNDDQFIVKGKYNFTDNVRISSEYIRVTCYDNKGKTNYTNYHYFIQRNESRLSELDQKLKIHIKTNKPAEVMNVMMVMMDGVSRLNHIRHMPKTRQFLLTNMSAIDFEGYNKVADNTYVNVVPVLTGNYVEEELVRSNTHRSGPFDNFNLIWKHFASKGYTTMFSEDCPKIATFNYLARGFRNQPCDYSIRPWTLATYKHFQSGKKCLWNRLESEYLLDYTYDFVKAFRKRPYFSLTTITRLTHDYLNHVAHADDSYLEFFKQLQREKLINNTIVMFFSDHGNRFSGILRTEIGQMELRMPMMYFVFPAWFTKKYPIIYKNLLNNRNKLTSNFDIHKTLEDIVHFKGKSRSNVDVNLRAQSLLDPISGNRSCRMADISPHWCMCKMDLVKLHDESLIKSSVEFTMSEINKELQNYTMCMSRTLQNITSFKRLKYINQRDLTETLIKMSIVSAPDSARFQTTLSYNAKTEEFKLVDSITRTNKYGHTADCVEKKRVRNYCYCKNQN